MGSGRISEGNQSRGNSAATTSVEQACEARLLGGVHRKVLVVTPIVWALNNPRYSQASPCQTFISNTPVSHSKYCRASWWMPAIARYLPNNVLDFV